MVRILALLAIVLTAAPPRAHAGYAQGVEAFARGDHERAAREFLEDARLGDAESAYMLGRLYALGSGVPEDWVQSWLWHDRAARLGHAEAEAARANMEAVMRPGQLAQARALAGQTATALPTPAPSVEPYDTGAYVPEPRPPRSTVIIPRN